MTSSTINNSMMSLLKLRRWYIENRTIYAPHLSAINSRQNIESPSHFCEHLNRFSREVNYFLLNRIVEAMCCLLWVICYPCMEWRRLKRRERELNEEILRYMEIDSNRLVNTIRDFAELKDVTREFSANVKELHRILKKDETTEAVWSLRRGCYFQFGAIIGGRFTLNTHLGSYDTWRVTTGWWEPMSWWGCNPASRRRLHHQYASENFNGAMGKEEELLGNMRWIKALEAELIGNIRSIGTSSNVTPSIADLTMEITRVNEKLLEMIKTIKLVKADYARNGVAWHYEKHR